MPIPANPSKKGTGILEADPLPGKQENTKIRYYTPDGKTFDKIYVDPNQMQRYREYYKDKGIKSRKITIL